MSSVDRMSYNPFFVSFSPLVSFLVNMGHSNQMFIDHFIHVVDQLEVRYLKVLIRCTRFF